MTALRRGASLLVAGALASALTAQPDHFTTAPEGYNYVEGESHSDDLLGTEPLLRFQQIDTTKLDDMMLRDRIAFRRDGRLPDNFDYFSRTIELEIVFSESDLAKVSTTFAANYVTNTATVVAKKRVSFADWTFAPTVLPAGQSTIIPLDQIYNYAGRPATGTDFLWEVRVYSNTMAGKRYPFDVAHPVPNAQFNNTGTQVASGQRLSIGCAVTGQANPFALALQLGNDGTSFQWDSATWYGTANAPVALLVDSQDHNLAVPSLCAPVHALFATIPHGTADNTGTSSFTFTMPRNRALLGADLFAQAATPDANQPNTPIALTGGVSVTVPIDPPTPKLGRLWALAPNATTATAGPIPGGIIIWTNHQ